MQVTFTCNFNKKVNRKYVKKQKQNLIQGRIVRCSRGIENFAPSPSRPLSYLPTLALKVFRTPPLVLMELIIESTLSELAVDDVSCLGGICGLSNLDHTDIVG